MRALLLLLLAPSLALAQGPAVTRDLGSVQTGPRILGEPAFVFELDALSQDETSRPGWPVTTTRASGATCIDGHSVGVNEACVSSVGLECFAAGVGGRTAGDLHTVPTDGWPTESGEIRLQYTPASPTADGEHYLLDTRGIGGSGGLTVRRAMDDRIVVLVNGVGSVQTGILEWGWTTEISVRWTSDTIVIRRDGLQVASSPLASPVQPHGAIAHIGTIRGGGAFWARGSIRLLRVSE